MVYSSFHFLSFFRTCIESKTDYLSHFFIRVKSFISIISLVLILILFLILIQSCPFRMGLVSRFQKRIDQVVLTSWSKTMPILYWFTPKLLIMAGMVGIEPCHKILWLAYRIRWMVVFFSHLNLSACNLTTRSKPPSTPR